MDVADDDDADDADADENQPRRAAETTKAAEPKDVGKEIQGKADAAGVKAPTTKKPAAPVLLLWDDERDDEL